MRHLLNECLGGKRGNPPTLLVVTWQATVLQLVLSQTHYLKLLVSVRRQTVLHCCWKVSVCCPGNDSRRQCLSWREH